MTPKFRAWQKYHKRMLKVKGIEFNKDVNIEAITVWNPLNTIPFTNTYIKDADFDIEALILMQSTGLKDKYGVEIYEGDIIEYKTVYEWDKKPIKRAEVVFENGVFGPIGVEMDLSRSEIIGNAYENPELLEV